MAGNAWNMVQITGHTEEQAEILSARSLSQWQEHPKASKQQDKKG